MKIGPLFKHFGSKWQSAKYYPAPKYGRLVEPYAGGAGYSLNHCDKKVQIWEDDPHLQVLWPWLIYKATPTDILDIPIDVPVGTDVRTLGLSCGQATLLKHWQRTNNCGDCWTVSPWGNKPGQWTANTRARVADQIGAVKHWEFGAPRYDVGNTTYFIDPPYQYNYRYKFRGFDYEMLKLSVDAIPSNSQVIVCEAACPKTGAIPTYLPFAENHRSVTSRRKSTQNHHSRELVYIR